MKTPLLLFFTCCLFFGAGAQITAPVIKANFGVDGDLRTNSFNGLIQSSDDWFSNGTLGTGRYVIDTTGAAAIRNGYAADVSPFPKRMASFYRTMSVAPYSVINNRLWLDALFVRDYHGNDTTTFIAGSDKNGMSPGNWSGGVQGIPDKNDILDMFMHVRRAGPTATDSLWLMGGLSLDNVTGNRYFDFEMYQTDISYDRASARWYGYGPDAGHTSWKFDAAGNVLTPGDIIFSAEYQSASLTNIEARIWIDKSALSTTPTAFQWSGKFDGDGTGATYGYASILPKNGGTFYTGLQCGNSEWAGAFNLVLQSNTLVTTYTAKQFMEFSVNLTKLGLDPTVFGTDVCGTPFNRMVVKTRASASFTAELKDFVAPTDLFLAARVQAVAEVPEVCGAGGVSKLQVTNPVSSSSYSWYTPNGSIVGSTTGPVVYAEKDGMYIVTQKLMDGCADYARDTVYLSYDATCTTLARQGSMGISAVLRQKMPQVQWNFEENSKAKRYEVQRSADGVRFETVYVQANTQPGLARASYVFADEGLAPQGQAAYYRIKAVFDGTAVYSSPAKLTMPLLESLNISPNPVQQAAQLWVGSQHAGTANVRVVNGAGNQVWAQRFRLVAGQNKLVVPQAGQWTPGVYLVVVETDRTRHLEKLVVAGGSAHR